MARQLRIVSASVHHPDERSTPVELRVGSSIYVGVVSDDLKGKPLHRVELTEQEALELIAALSDAILNKRTAARQAARRGQP